MKKVKGAFDYDSCLNLGLPPSKFITPLATTIKIELEKMCR